MGTGMGIRSLEWTASRWAVLAGLALCGLIVAAAIAPMGAQATGDTPPNQPHTVSLTAGFAPERLGAPTTIDFALRIATQPGSALSPLTELQVLLPRGLSIATSDLGLETCKLAALESEGIAGCPPDSLMGRGSADAEVRFGSTSVTEQALIKLFSGPVLEGHPQLLIAAEGEFPVLASILFTALVLPAPAPYGGMIQANPPLVPGLPGDPDVAVVSLSTTIGGRGITYVERVKGRTIRFHPRSVLLPPHCPRGGFLFAANLTFQDATQASARTRVPCPSSRRRG